MTSFTAPTIPAAAGIGLRHPHYQKVINDTPEVPWLEVHPENFFADGGISTDILEKIRESYPLSIHGVGLSLGSADDISTTHLSQLKKIITRFEPGLVSEHVSWSHIDGVYMNDLLPLPLTEEALTNLVQHIEQTQDFLGRQILIENPSSYLAFHHSTIPEHEFMVEAAKRSGCGILLDINNIYVCQRNHAYDGKAYISHIPTEIIGEMHLAGHSITQIEGKELLIDTHGDYVCDEVWELYQHAIQHHGPIPSLIEWDTNIPAFDQLQQEAKKAQHILNQYEHRHEVA